MSGWAERGEWTADEWAKDLMTPSGGLTFVSVSITRGKRRDLVVAKYRDENGKPASVTVRTRAGGAL